MAVPSASDGRQSVGLGVDGISTVGQNKTGIINLSFNNDFFGHGTQSEDNVRDFFDIYSRLGAGFTNTQEGSMLADWNSVAGRIFHQEGEEQNGENQHGRINAFFLGFCIDGNIRGILSSEGQGFYGFGGGAAAGYHLEDENRVFNLVATTGPFVGDASTGDVGIHYFLGGRAIFGFEQDKEKIFIRKIVLDGKIEPGGDFWKLSAVLYGSVFDSLGIFAGVYAESLKNGQEADINAAQIGVAYQWRY